MLEKLLDDLLNACAIGAGYEDAACALNAEIETIENGVIVTKGGQRWAVTASSS